MSFYLACVAIVSGIIFVIMPMMNGYSFFLNHRYSFFLRAGLLQLLCLVLWAAFFGVMIFSAAIVGDHLFGR